MGSMIASTIEATMTPMKTMIAGSSRLSAEAVKLSNS